jgi:hypothetical protein
MVRNYETVKEDFVLHYAITPIADNGFGESVRSVESSMKESLIETLFIVMCIVPNELAARPTL